jgi:hypothetical protein
MLIRNSLRAVTGGAKRGRYGNIRNGIIGTTI